MSIDDIVLECTSDVLRVLFQYLFGEDPSLSKEDVYRAFKEGFKMENMAPELAWLMEKQPNEIK